MDKITEATNLKFEYDGSVFKDLEKLMAMAHTIKAAKPDFEISS
jgi:hypothetical protein